MAKHACNLRREGITEDQIGIIGRGSDIGLCPCIYQTDGANAVLCLQIFRGKKNAGMVAMFYHAGAADRDVLDANDLLRVWKVNPKPRKTSLQGGSKTEGNDALFRVDRRRKHLVALKALTIRLIIEIKGVGTDWIFLIQHKAKTKV